MVTYLNDNDSQLVLQRLFNAANLTKTSWNHDFVQLGTLAKELQQDPTLVVGCFLASTTTTDAELWQLNVHYMSYDLTAIGLQSRHIRIGPGDLSKCCALTPEGSTKHLFAHTNIPFPHLAITIRFSYNADRGEHEYEVVHHPTGTVRHALRLTTHHSSQQARGSFSSSDDGHDSHLGSQLSQQTLARLGISAQRIFSKTGKHVLHTMMYDMSSMEKTTLHLNTTLAPIYLGIGIEGAENVLNMRFSDISTYRDVPQADAEK